MRSLVLQGSILSLQASIVSVQGPQWLWFEPLKLLNFDFNEVTDLDFYFNADPETDAAFKNNANLDLPPWKKRM
jgi:hypothetical protein